MSAIQYKHTKGEYAPNIEDLAVGEIYLRIYPGDERLFLKVSDNQLCSFRLDGTTNYVKEGTESHLSSQNNPHKIKQETLNLENVENHSDLKRATSAAESVSLDTKINISDIYSSLTKDNTILNYDGLPISASMGVVISDSVYIFNNQTVGLEKLEQRITALENWQ